MYKVAEKDVRYCPYTRASLGVVYFPTDLVAELSGLVQDKLEWALLIKGRKEGLETWVDSFEVPPQERTGGNVEISEVSLDDIIGVVHSHNSMKAFFSTTDLSKLNPRFGLSIVIAQALDKIGFAYKAEAKYELPCGALGIVEYKIVPLVEDWPEEWKFEPILAHDDGKWGDCKKHKEEKSPIIDKYWIDVTEKAECGIERKERWPLAFSLGQKSDLMKEIEEKTIKPIPRELPTKYHPAVSTPKGVDLKKKQGSPRSSVGEQSTSDGQYLLPSWAESNGYPESSFKPGIYKNKYICKCNNEWESEGQMMIGEFCIICRVEVIPHAASWIKEPQEEIVTVVSGMVNNFYKCTRDGFEWRCVGQPNEWDYCEKCNKPVDPFGEAPANFIGGVDTKYPFYAHYHCGEPGCYIDWSDLAETEYEKAACPNCQKMIVPWASESNNLEFVDDEAAIDEQLEQESSQEYAVTEQMIEELNAYRMQRAKDLEEVFGPLTPDERRAIFHVVKN